MLNCNKNSSNGRDQFGLITKSTTCLLHKCSVIVKLHEFTYMKRRINSGKGVHKTSRRTSVWIKRKNYKSLDCKTYLHIFWKHKRDLLDIDLFQRQINYIIVQFIRNCGRGVYVRSAEVRIIQPIQLISVTRLIDTHTERLQLVLVAAFWIYLFSTLAYTITVAHLSLDHAASSSSVGRQHATCIIG